MQARKKTKIFFVQDKCDTISRLRFWCQVSEIGLARYRCQQVITQLLMANRNLVLFDPGLRLPDFAREEDILPLFLKITEGKQTYGLGTLFGEQEVRFPGEGLSKE